MRSIFHPPLSRCEIQPLSRVTGVHARNSGAMNTFVSCRRHAGTKQDKEGAGRSAHLIQCTQIFTLRSCNPLYTPNSTSSEQINKKSLVPASAAISLMCLSDSLYALPESYLPAFKAPVMAYSFCFVLRRTLMTRVQPPASEGGLRMQSLIHAKEVGSTLGYHATYRFSCRNRRSRGCRRTS